MMSTTLSLSVFTMILDLHIAHYGETMGLMEAQMYGIDDVFLYSSIILFFCVAVSLTLKSNQNRK